jgi:tetratricopeptide (TPR) repeat protein
MVSAARFTVGAALLVLAGAQARGDELSAMTPKQRLERALAHFEAGRAHYKLGSYEEAMRDFSESYRYQPEPLLLFNLAQAARKAGHRDLALAKYREFVRAQPHAEQRGEADGYIGELEQLPPDGSVEPPPAAPPPAAPAAKTPATDNVLVAAPTPRSRRPLWIGLGAAGAAVVVLALVLGLSFGLTGSAPVSGLGNYQPFR